MNPIWREYVLLVLSVCIYWTLLHGSNAIQDRILETSACYGSDPRCTTLKFNCQNRKIVILSAKAGFRNTSNNVCSREISSCKKNPCCNASSTDVLIDYKSRDIQELYRSCWMKTQCNWTVIRVKNPYSRSGYDSFSSFTNSRYLCLADFQIVAFKSSDTKEAFAVAIRYVSNDSYPLKSDETRFWNCAVTSLDQHEVHVTLVKDQNGTPNTSDHCSSIGNSGSYLPCGNSPGTDVSYRTFTSQPPFSISLRLVHGSPMHTAWAVIAAGSQGKVTVSCGTHAAARNGSANGGDDASPSTVNPVAVGVVVFLVLLVVGGIILFFVLRRRGVKLKFRFLERALFKGGNSEASAEGAGKLGSADISAPRLQHEDLHAEDAGKGQEEAYVTITDVDISDVPMGSGEETDYNHLGDNKASSAPSMHRNPYGQLGAMSLANDVTEYDYNHLTRGRHDDVIDGNDYDTARAGLSSRSAENGGYDVAVIKGSNRVEVVDSPYDLARLPS